MPAPEVHLAERRHKWQVRAMVGAGVLVVVAASLWLSHDSLPGAVKRIGGRFREESTAGGTDAIFRSILGDPVRTDHWIDLEHSHADDAWMTAHREELARQTHLILFLRNSQITAQGLAALSGMENIDGLDLTGTPLDDTALESIATLPQLLQLELGHTGISDAALANLARSPTLAHVSLDRTQATPAGISHLAKCPRLNGLRLVDADNEAVANAAALGQLDYLYVHGDQLTAECLPGLAQMSHLEILTLIDSKFSADELAALRQALSRCSIQQLTEAEIADNRESWWPRGDQSL